MDAQEPKAAHPQQERLKPRPAVLRTVAYAFLVQSLVLPLARDAAQEFLMVVVREIPWERQMESRAAQ